MLIWYIFYSLVSVSALTSSTSSDLPRISVMTSRGLDQLRLSSSVPSSAVKNPLTLIFWTFSFSNLPVCAILDCEAVLCVVLNVWRLGDSLQNIFNLFAYVLHTILSIPASSLYTRLNITLALSFLKIIKIKNKTIKLVYLFVLFFLLYPSSFHYMCLYIF